MKNLKKLLCGMLALVMVMGLAACGGNPSSDNSTPPAGNSQPAGNGDDANKGDVANDPKVT